MRIIRISCTSTRVAVPIIRHRRESTPIANIEADRLQRAGVDDETVTLLAGDLAAALTAPEARGDG